VKKKVDQKKILIKVKISSAEIDKQARVMNDEVIFNPGKV
jgi:hypothetical protein